MEDNYFYLLLDAGDRVLIDGNVKYLVTEKDGGSITILNVDDNDTMKLTGRDIETYFWTIDEHGELTVEFSEEKERLQPEEDFDSVQRRMAESLDNLWA